jgi:enoyl-CoA hydratase
MAGSLVRIELRDDIAVLSMRRGKGNALNPVLVEDLLDALRVPEVAEEARAVVLTGEDRFFSSGLDLVELGGLDREQMLAFLDRLQGLLATVFVWNRPVIAAINGHAIAGGCLLALCADWKILGKGGAKMGLNEINLGLPLPQAGLEIARAQLTPPAWAEVVYGGELHEAANAHRLGLADQLVAEEDVLGLAVERAELWASRPRVAFHRVKASLRDRVLLKIRKDHEEHQEEWVNLWFAPSAQERIQEVRARLMQKG